MDANNGDRARNKPSEENQSEKVMIYPEMVRFEVADAVKFPLQYLQSWFQTYHGMDKKENTKVLPSTTVDYPETSTTWKDSQQKSALREGSKTNLIQAKNDGRHQTMEQKRQLVNSGDWIKKNEKPIKAHTLAVLRIHSTNNELPVGMGEFKGEKHSSLAVISEAKMHDIKLAIETVNTGGLEMKFGQGFKNHSKTIGMDSKLLGKSEGAQQRKTTDKLNGQRNVYKWCEQTLKKQAPSKTATQNQMRQKLF